LYRVSFPVGLFRSVHLNDGAAGLARPRVHDGPEQFPALLADGQRVDAVGGKAFVFFAGIRIRTAF